MAQWRTPTTGEFLNGNAPGDVPIWNGFEWIPGPGGGGGAMPLSRTFIVDGTSTAPGVPDGSIAHPFVTIAAAMAAGGALPILEPFSVLVGPGTYVEQVIWPERDRVALVGSGPGETIIEAPAGASSALEFAPAAAAGAAIHRMDVRDLTLVSGPPAQMALRMVSSTFFPLTTLDDGAYFLRVNCQAAFNGGPGQAAFISGIGNLYVADSFWATSTALGFTGTEVTQIENCTTAFFSRCRLGDLHTNYTDGPTTPGSGRSIYQIDNATQIETRWIISGHPICAAAPGTAVRGTSGIVPTIDAAGLTNGITHSAQLFLAGLVGNPVDPGSGAVVVTFPDQAGAPEPANLALLGGTFLGTMAVGQLAGGLPRIIVPAYGATFMAFAPGSILAGLGIDLDLRAAKFEQPALAIALSGTIDRSQILLPPALLGPGPNLIPIVPPLPAYRLSGYTVAFTDLAPVPGGPVSFPLAALLSGGFSAVTAAGGFGGFTVFLP